MTTIEQIVGDTRSLLSGSLAPEIGILAQPYSPGDSTVTFAQPRRITDGTTMCVGLTTLRALGGETQAPRVVAGTDGSPDVAAPSGTIVHIMPRNTTWQAFTELVSTVAELSSPDHGLYSAVTEQFPSDTVDGTYPLSRAPMKVIRVRYLRPGSTDEWSDVAWDYRPAAGGTPTVHVVSPVPGGTTVEVVTGQTFKTPQALDDTLASLDIPDSYRRLLAVGAARNLSLSSESRRMQPFSQGDPRRAEEVPPTGNVVVYDRLARDFRNLVAQERANLISQHPYKTQMERFYARMGG